MCDGVLIMKKITNNKIFGSVCVIGMLIGIVVVCLFWLYKRN